MELILTMAASMVMPIFIWPDSMALTLSGSAFLMEATSNAGAVCPNATTVTNKRLTLTLWIFVFSILIPLCRKIRLRRKWCSRNRPADARNGCLNSFGISPLNVPNRSLTVAALLRLLWFWVSYRAATVRERASGQNLPNPFKHPFWETSPKTQRLDVDYAP